MLILHYYVVYTMCSLGGSYSIKSYKYCPKISCSLMPFTIMCLHITPSLSYRFSKVIVTRYHLIPFQRLLKQPL